MRDREVLELEQQWKSDKRWAGQLRPFSAEDVIGLRGAVKIEYTLARLGAERLCACSAPSRTCGRWAPRPACKRCSRCRRA